MNHTRSDTFRFKSNNNSVVLITLASSLFLCAAQLVEGLRLVACATLRSLQARALNEMAIADFERLL